MTTSSTRSPFMRFAAAVADFGDPFYAEERQRDVWNEASAFGFQLLLWGAFVVSAAMVWIGGQQAVPYAAALLGLTGLGSAMTIVYARRLAVEPLGNWSTSWARCVALTLVLLALVLGLLRDPGSDDGFGQGLLAGMVVGVAVGMVSMGVAAARRWGRRKPDRRAHDDE